MSYFKYTYHRFNSEQEFKDALEEIILEKHQYCIDDIGILYNEPTFQINGDWSTSEIPGYHVNVAWLDGVPLPKKFKDSEIVVITPKRVWA